MGWLEGEVDRVRFLQMVLGDTNGISKLLQNCGSCRAVFLVGSVINLDNPGGQQLKSYLTVNAPETFALLGQEKFVQFSSRQKMPDEVWNRRDQLMDLIWN